MTLDEMNEVFDMTSHKGWSILMRDSQVSVDSLKEELAAGYKPEYQLGHLHGRIAVLRHLISFRDILEVDRENAKEDANEIDPL
jgi:hypothetical protein